MSFPVLASVRSLERCARAGRSTAVVDLRLEGGRLHGGVVRPPA